MTKSLLIRYHLLWIYQLALVMNKLVYEYEGFSKELWNSVRAVEALDIVFQQDVQIHDKKMLLSFVDEC